ncbi:MAG: YhbY family RNA-binding protein [Verrucomicrobiales bacterium]|jgi:RNA-binding protein|nr:YhbY family RNA-binding protein [Verrucomicrobiales bacterium]
MMTLTNSEQRTLKAQAQRLEPILKVGKGGLSTEFLEKFQHTQQTHPLLKIQFTAHKDEKKPLTMRLAELTGSVVVQQVGNIAVLYKPAASR